VSEEANERLVHLYLDARGYLLTSNTKYRIPRTITTKTGSQIQRTPYEADIIAINPTKRDRIWGEVKGWESGVQKRHFRELWKEHEQWQRNTKIFNDDELRHKLNSAIEGRYGPGFRLVLYCDHIKPADRIPILAYAKKNHFEIVEMEEIVRGLMKVKDEQAYTNDPTIQLLRVMQRRKMLK